MHTRHRDGIPWFGWPKQPRICCKLEIHDEVPYGCGVNRQRPEHTAGRPYNPGLSRETSLDCRRRKLLAQVKYRAVLPQLFVDILASDTLNGRAMGDGENGRHTRGLPDDHVLRLHAHRGVRGMAGREADGDEQVFRFGSLRRNTPEGDLV